MKNPFLLVAFVLLAGCASENKEDNASQKKATENVAEKQIPTTPVKTAQASVNWIGVNELEKSSKKASKKVIVDLYTSWCGWCKRMDKLTFGNNQIADYVNEHFHPVKFNAEMKESLEFKGKNYNFKSAGRRGYNELAYEFAGGRMSYPTLAFLDENLEKITSIPGFKQPHQLDPILRFVNEDHYKSQSLGEFQKTFKSDIPAQPMPGRRGGTNNQVIKLNNNNNNQIKVIKKQ